MRTDYKYHKDPWTRQVILQHTSLGTDDQLINK